MIDEFYVNNYKCLVDVRLPLTPIHVIIGQNDSGKTSLLEAMLALSRSTEKPLDQAFPGEWQGRELVYAGAEKPVSSSRSVSVPTEGEIRSPLTYHLEVEFGGRTVMPQDRRMDRQWRNVLLLLREVKDGQGLRRRVDLGPGALRDHLDSIAGQLGPRASIASTPN